MVFRSDVYEKIYHPQPEATPQQGGGLVKPQPKKKAKLAEAEEQKPTEPEKAEEVQEADENAEEPETTPEEEGGADE